MKNADKLVNLVVGSARFSRSVITPSESEALTLLIQDDEAGLSLKERFSNLATLASQVFLKPSEQPVGFAIETSIASIVAGTIWRYPTSAFVPEPNGMRRDPFVNYLCSHTHSQKWIRGVVIGFLRPWEFIQVVSEIEPVKWSDDIPGQISVHNLEQVITCVSHFMIEFSKNEIIKNGMGDFETNLSELIAGLLKRSPIFNCHLGPQFLRKWLELEDKAHFSEFGTELVSQIVHKAWGSNTLEDKVKLALSNLLP